MCRSRQPVAKKNEKRRRKAVERRGRETIRRRRRRRKAVERRGRKFRRRRRASPDPSDKSGESNQR
jgi:hypothetical protein